MINNPPKSPEPEVVEEPVEPEPVVEIQAMEEVTMGDGEDVKVEEVVKEEEEVEDDETGLFSAEFDDLMDPSGFENDLGFSQGMDWMDNV